MRMKLFHWLGKEFVALSGEGRAELSARDQARDLLLRFDRELRAQDLSLDNTVRTRLWGKDRESRDQGGAERVSVLSGAARSASSSYIAPRHFDSGASVALDLLAMRPARAGVEKLIREYDPPIVPVRYIVYDEVVFLSGVTAVLPNLPDQVVDVLSRIEGSLAEAGSSWERVARVSCYLQRGYPPATVLELLRETARVDTARVEVAFVDGYSAPGKLIEIEVTGAL